MNSVSVVPLAPAAEHELYYVHCCTGKTLGAIGRVMGKNLLVLKLNGLSKYPDDAFASMLSRLPSLEVLDLRYSKE